MNVDLSIWHLVAQASWVVKIVMLLLVAASVASWAMIFRKRAQLNMAARTADAFEDRFWSGGDISKLYGDIHGRRDDALGIERIFLAGFRDFTRLRKQPGFDSDTIIESVKRAMRVATARETDDLETNLSFLATVGSTSPYVGLFGTVWGIMNSFQSLGQMQYATLQTVAPGIAEALIATAIGLFAAIPAVIAYNKYAAQVERVLNSYETFAEEFIAILQRQILMQPGSNAAAA
jgi:biopolymer transport protein TolQ